MIVLFKDRLHHLVYYENTGKQTLCGLNREKLIVMFTHSRQGTQFRVCDKCDLRATITDLNKTKL